ncbi:hypothetical protein H1Z61_14680 [Bacillus aquiflavi]|uniref:Uncharacterized protein n=1 Tax=Bacillus aquiflavi TaxID=2672567 RepID=A0A6B3W0H9_9BACI|nr:hypothetical protein [Bacillus aquiflavi]MBA4538344.1 hypothetical protein [Bacillus aquiflavi]NEY82692.1 hypothetical protein [Bacillus aquiflavi]
MTSSERHAILGNDCTQVAMNRFDRHHKHKEKQKRQFKKVRLMILSACLMLVCSFYIYIKSTAKIKEPNPDLGKKVVIHLPNGSTVFTYENLIIEENGKLYYKGERNTIDLTGGKVVYENWE